MKTTFIYTAIFSCFFLFSSCSAEEEDSQTDNPELQAQLQGKWRYEGLTINGVYEEALVLEGDQFYDFKAGGVLVLSDEGGSLSGTYQLIGDELTLSIDGDTATFEITKLTNSELDLFGMLDVDEEEGLEEVTFHLSKN